MKPGTSLALRSCSRVPSVPPHPLSFLQGIRITHHWRKESGVQMSERCAGSRVPNGLRGLCHQFKMISFTLCDLYPVLTSLLPHAWVISQPKHAPPRALCASLRFPKTILWRESETKVQAESHALTMRWADVMILGYGWLYLNIFLCYSQTYGPHLSLVSRLLLTLHFPLAVRPSVCDIHSNRRAGRSSPSSLVDGD